MADSKVVSLSGYRKKKEAEAKTKEEEAALQVYIDHAKSLKW